MAFDLILASAFVGSSGILWYRISQKIPELVAIPDEIIVDRLHEDSARIRVFVLSIRRYWREDRHWELFWRFSEKALHRLHIFMLRADNGIMTLLKKVRGVDTISAGNGDTNGTHQKEMQSSPIQAPLFKSQRIQEVRRKKAQSVIPE